MFRFLENQTPYLLFMRSLGYQISLLGGCFGMSYEASLSCLSDDIDNQPQEDDLQRYIQDDRKEFARFLKRLDFMKTSIAASANGARTIDELQSNVRSLIKKYEEEFMRTSKEEKDSTTHSYLSKEILPFCDGINLIQVTNKYRSVFPEDLIFKADNHRAALELVSPIIFDDNDNSKLPKQDLDQEKILTSERHGIYSNQNKFPLCYNELELSVALGKLAKKLDDTEQRKAIAFVVSCERHAIHVGYNPTKKNPWSFFDPNGQEFKYFSNDKKGLAKLSSAIKGANIYSGENIMLDISAISKDAALIDAFDQWQASEWQDTTKKTDRIDSFDNTLLHHACFSLQENQMSELGKLIKGGCDINKLSKYLDIKNPPNPLYLVPPLYFAILGDNQNVVPYLLEQGAKLDSEYLLPLAISRGNTSIIARLLEHKIDINKPYYLPLKHLMEADDANYAWFRISMETKIPWGDLNESKLRIKPLDDAIIGNRPQILELLLKNKEPKLDINIKDTLLLACVVGSKEVLPLLVARTDPEVFKTEYLPDMIMHASLYGNLDLARDLIITHNFNSKEAISTDVNRLRNWARLTNNDKNLNDYLKGKAIVKNNVAISLIDIAIITGNHHMVSDKDLIQSDNEYKLRLQCLKSKIQAFPFNLNGGGIKIDGKRYPKSAGEILLAINTLLSDNQTINEDRYQNLVKDIKTMLHNKTNVQAKGITIGGFRFFNWSERDTGTASFYQEALEFLDHSRKDSVKAIR